jgi:UDP-glucose 4-epimerase
MRLLVTGGAGYIGSTVVLYLLAAGHAVRVIDDLSTGYAEALRRVEQLAGQDVQLVRANVADAPAVRRALEGMDAVLHFAASKVVGESMAHPERYLQNNVGALGTLLAEMEAAGVRRLVYSSSAAVYGTQREMPISEAAPLLPESPYGLSKVHGEQWIEWMVRCHGWAAVSLRYFNPVGAHASGRIGQPVEGAQALLPRALLALVREESPLTVFGSDWPTPDGTALRDYIHIADLAAAHRHALAALAPGSHGIFNVGTGRPHSVAEVLASCQRVTGREVPHVLGPRRPGDMACATADPSRFRAATGFVAARTLDDMVATAWRWTEENPGGYAS